MDTHAESLQGEVERLRAVIRSKDQQINDLRHKVRIMEDFSLCQVTVVKRFKDIMNLAELTQRRVDQNLAGDTESEKYTILYDAMIDVYDTADQAVEAFCWVPARSCTLQSKDGSENTQTSESPLRDEPYNEALPIPQLKIATTGSLSHSEGPLDPEPYALLDPGSQANPKPVRYRLPTFLWDPPPDRLLNDYNPFSGRPGFVWPDPSDSSDGGDNEEHRAAFNAPTEEDYKDYTNALQKSSQDDQLERVPQEDSTR